MQWIKGWVWGNSMLNVNQSTHTFYFSWPKWDVSSINQIQYAFQLEPNVEILTQDRETKELLYFPKVKSAKTCLALPEAVIEPIKYRGSFEMDTLMQFINEKAETHRQLDGKLTLHGETIEYLNNNRYTVEPNDVCSRISASELNSTRFLTDFVKRNRPVIITDALQVRNSTRNSCINDSSTIIIVLASSDRMDDRLSTSTHWISSCSCKTLSERTIRRLRTVVWMGKPRESDPTTS